MTSKATPSPLAERTDVHKSCKSLETLLGVLNDYCEAVGAAALLQKKLAKALRDAAGMKTTGEIAANALNTSAVIFEVSSDVNSKFARFADKEYDAISAEVKKWFKKLAKEEKMHDERMASANARIKQAGQQYEKKTKKNPNDATEEHARYLNVITVLGPEMSQEKYHAFSVTQRHATTTNNAASCLGRIADAEWLKTCESVRRFSPNIGQLGEWRSLCEGGWSGPAPPDLVDVNEDRQPQSDRDDKIEKTGEGENPLLTSMVKNAETASSRELAEQVPPSTGQFSTGDPGSPHEYLAPRHSPTLLKTDTQGSANDAHTSVPPSSYQPQHQSTQRNNEDTVRSLSAFPLPPTHFPIPPPRQQQPSHSHSSQSSVYASIPRLTESPLPESTEDGDDRQLPASGSRKTSASPEQPLRDKPTVPDTDLISPPHTTPETNIKQPVPARSPTQPPSADTFNADAEAAARANVNTQKANEDQFDVDHEFGYGAKPRNAELVRSRALERNDTGGSSGSIVAAMKNRYANNSGATSPTQKEIPRVSVSVNDLANRYQPMDGPYPARVRTSSASSRQLPVAPVDSISKPRQSNSFADTDVLGHGHGSSAAFGSPRQEEAERRRHQRLNDLAQLELREKELAMLKREQEIEKRAQELERDRARLHDVREANEFGDENDGPSSDSVPSPYAQLRPRERKTSFRTQRPVSQLDGGNSPTALHGNNNVGRPQSQYSLSTSHLVPPSPSISAQPSQSSHNSQYSHSPAMSSHTSTHSTSAHAPYCGCEACSASKYRASSSPVDRTHLRPPAEPINLRPIEKSKPGWIRRLSMPVGNAFNLDSKKGIGNIATGGGMGRSGIFSMDGKKNMSSTLLHADEHGRRSYDRSGGISNQSMTELGLGRR